MEVSYPVPVALAMLGMAMLSLLLARFERVVGEQHDCPALVADSFHARVDMFGSLVVAVALFGESLDLTIDRWGALILALFVLSQAVNAFGAAAVAGTNGEEKRKDYHLWLWAWFARLTRRLADFAVTRLGRRFGWADNPQARRRAKRYVAAGGAALLLSGYVASGLFTVGPGMQGIVEVFGRPIDPDRPLGPGLHYRLPWPFAATRDARVGEVRRLSVGSSVKPDRRTILWTNRHYDSEFNLLTGENIFIDVGIVIHYRIADLAAWLYGCRDPEAVIAAAAESAITELSSSRPFLSSMTSGRQELEQELAARVEEYIARHPTGVDLVNLHIRDIHPPTTVARDFEAVVSAMIEYETAINEARGYANTLVPSARGKAQAILLEASAKRDAAQREARAKVARFDAERSAYCMHPATTRARMRIERLESVLADRTKIIVPADAADGAIELILSTMPSKKLPASLPKPSPRGTRPRVHLEDEE
jgi:membrane protease subunit HflK